MSARGRKRHREPWREVLAHDLRDESEDERCDYADDTRPEPAIDPDTGRNNVDAILARRVKAVDSPEIGTDGDDSPTYASPKSALAFSGRQVRVKLKNGKTGQVEVIEQVVDRTGAKATSNPAGELVADGHGFVVNDPRSRPWKTAKRTHCAYCGGPLPLPDVSKYRCEFEPDATEESLAVIDEHNYSSEFDPGWRSRYLRKHRLRRGCQCSGCRLRWLVANGYERNRGQPRKYCSDDCRRWADNERKAWNRAVATARKRGEEPPPPPEDRGLKFVPRSGLRSSVEGSGHRY